MRKMPGISVACLVVLIAVGNVALDAGAQNSTATPGYSTIRPEGRAGTWDFFIPLTYNPSSSWNGPGGSKVDLDPTFGFGFGGGYNVTDHFQVNGIFSWSARDYSAKVINSDLTNRQYSKTLYTSTFSLNGIVYFPRGKISSFLTGGVGVTYLDTNIQTAPAGTICWWDPWYGYVCNTAAPTKTETDLSYSAGVGIRFAVTPKFSLQPSYNKMWIDIGNASHIPGFDVWRLDFIFRMP